MATIVQADELVSSYGASRLLQRDRQTIERAVRNLVPDAYTSGGKPRWKLSRIAAVLAVPAQQRREVGRSMDRYRVPSRVLDDLQRRFEEGVAAIEAEPSEAKKREMAVALAPLLAEYQQTYLDVGRSIRVADHDAIGARADLIWSEMMSEVSEAAQWPRDGSDFFQVMFNTMWPNAEDDEVA